MRRVWLVVSLAASCSDHATSALTPADVFQQLADHECARAFACRASFAGSSTDFETRFGPDEPTCVAMALAGNEIAEITASVDAGRIDFDPDAAAACIDSPDAGTCADFFAHPTDLTACDAVFVGTVISGGTCTVNDDCVAGLFCNLELFACAPD